MLKGIQEEQKQLLGEKLKSMNEKKLKNEQKELLDEKSTSMKDMPKNINDPKFENYLIEVGAIYGARQVIDALKKLKIQEPKVISIEDGENRDEKIQQIEPGKGNSSF